LVWRRLLQAFLAVALLAGCGITYVPPKKLPPILTEPTAPPSQSASKGEAAGNIACPKTIGSAAGYTLFGAPAPDFNAGHPGSSLLIRCATDGKVIVLQLDISPAVPAADALAIARRQLPSDLQPVYDRVQLNCRDVQLQSKTLAARLGSDDPDGVVNIELESALATDFKYDPGHVDTAVIHQQDDLNVPRPCLRS
jgi:hypothetical protein